MRNFPKPDLNQLKHFVIQTNLLERLPMNITTIETALKEGKETGDPLATGQFSAVNMVLRDIAPRDDLIPQPEKLRGELDSHDHLKWMRDLHTAMMTPIYLHGQKVLDPYAPPKHTIGTYRSSRKVLGPRVMPSPITIKKTLHRWLLDLAKYNKDISLKLNNPRMLSKMDIHDIAMHAYHAGIQICCIKPFEDGSNRIGRLVENAIRLNWGLPWKTILIDKKDEYLNDIFEMQKRFPENV